MKVRLLPTRPSVPGFARCVAAHAAPPRSRGNALALSLCGLLFVSVLSPACKKVSAVSAEKAKANVANLKKATHSDVAEVRAGLPLGAPFLLPVFTTGKPPSDDTHG